MAEDTGDGIFRKEPGCVRCVCCTCWGGAQLGRKMFIEGGMTNVKKNSMGGADAREQLCVQVKS